MKKLLSLAVALVLCSCLCAVAAETKVESSELEARSIELNEKANTLLVTDNDTRMKRVADLEMNPLSEDYPYMDIKEGYYVVIQDNDLKRGLLDGQGKLLLPLEYADFEILSDRWIAGIRLVPSTSDNYDYKSLLGSDSFYLIDGVDFFYRGEKKGGITRAEWKRAECYGDYLCLTDRDGNVSFYNKDFEKSGAATSYAREYEEDYSTKTVTHLGSNQQAFTASCTLTADEVKQAAWVNYDAQLVDLQGNVLADLSNYNSTIMDADSGYIKLRNGAGKYGLADETGREILPCVYDSLGYQLEGARDCGYLYAERDGKGGFVNLSTGAETGFSFTADAGKQRASFIFVDDPREGKILISAAAGELPGRYKDANAFYPGRGDACPYAVVQEQDDTCRVIGQAGEDLLPGVTFRSVYDPEFSEDGRLILLKTENGHYTLYRIAYDPDLSAVATAAPAADESWTCENGHAGQTGKFCSKCGAKKPD